MKALVTGATGFIGRRLLRQLQQPVVLTRQPGKAKLELAEHQPTIYAWDAMSGPPKPEVFAGVDAVIHLAGDPVAEGRWTAAKKQRIRDSRVIGTRNLVEGLKSAAPRTTVLVSASAVGYYGDRGDQAIDESTPPGDDFLAEVCKEWEAESARARELGIRVVNPRIGLVLGHGGALPRMLTPFKFGLGGRLGSGQQWMPWIHVDDLVGLILHALHDQGLSGPMNGVVPHPVTNAEFTKTLGETLHRPTILPAPYFALRVALGEFAKVLFTSQRVLPHVAERSGYAYQYPQLSQALKEILKR